MPVHEAHVEPVELEVGALGEELVIEIRNSEIQKMLLTFIKFIQDNSRVIDANELLRSVIAEMEGVKVHE